MDVWNAHLNTFALDRATANWVRHFGPQWWLRTLPNNFEWPRLINALLLNGGRKHRSCKRLLIVISVRLFFRRKYSLGLATFLFFTFFQVYNHLPVGFFQQSWLAFYQALLINYLSFLLLLLLLRNNFLHFFIVYTEKVLELLLVEIARGRGRIFNALTWGMIWWSVHLWQGQLLFMLFLPFLILKIEL